MKAASHTGAGPQGPEVCFPGIRDSTSPSLAVERQVAESGHFSTRSSLGALPLTGLCPVVDLLAFSFG